MTTPGPVSVAVLNDYEIVVEGVARMLEPFPDRVQVLEVAVNTSPSQDVDVCLYDNFGQAHHQDLEVPALRDQARARHLVIYTWHSDPAVIEFALREGASGYLSKSLSSEELVTAIERVHGGEVVVTDDRVDPHPGTGDWPGRREGLSEREAEVIALITQGLSNDQIADRAYLSVNTVKSYIRTAYRKMGVGSRSQAVLWGVEHGFRSDRVVRRRVQHEAH